MRLDNRVVLEGWIDQKDQQVPAQCSSWADIGTACNKCSILTIRLNILHHFCG